MKHLKILIDNKIPFIKGALEEVAEVSDTFAEQRELARYNKNASVGISLIKRADANVVKVAESVEEELAKKALLRVAHKMPIKTRLVRRKHTVG